MYNGERTVSHCVCMQKTLLQSDPKPLDAVLES